MGADYRPWTSAMCREQKFGVDSFSWTLNILLLRSLTFPPETGQF